MIVTVDGQKLDQDFAADLTLQGLIEAVRSGRETPPLVVGVAVDGEICANDTLSARLGETLAGVQQVDLETGHPHEIARHALLAVAEQMQTVGAAQVEIAAQLNSGQVAAAVARISDFVQAWQMVQQALVQISHLLERDLTAVTYDNQPVAAHLAELLTRLTEIKDALAAHDMVLLADLIHYEMPAVCAHWHNLLTDLAQTIE